MCEIFLCFMCDVQFESLSGLFIPYKLQFITIVHFMLIPEPRLRPRIQQPWPCPGPAQAQQTPAMSEHETNTCTNNKKKHLNSPIQKKLASQQTISGSKLPSGTTRFTYRKCFSQSSKTHSLLHVLQIGASYTFVLFSPHLISSLLVRNPCFLLQQRFSSVQNTDMGHFKKNYRSRIFHFQFFPKSEGIMSITHSG